MSWWLSGGISAGDCVAAYQAIGAANIAASKVNLNDPGTNDIDVGTDPAFDAATGWSFNGSTHYLGLSSYSIVDTPFTVVARMNANIAAAATSIICGLNNISTTGSARRNWAIKAEQYLNTGKLGISAYQGTGDVASDLNTPSGDSVVIITRSGTSVIFYSGASSSEKSVTINYSNAKTGFYIGASLWDATVVDRFTGYIAAISYYHTVITSDQRAAITAALLSGGIPKHFMHYQRMRG